MADKRLDDYKPLKFYTDNRPGDADKTGFYKFADGSLEYFAYQVDGKPILISQGYKARAGRDNGIVSTTKNMKIEDQIVFHKHPNGKHYFDVVARNKQQVATSVWFASEKAARAHADVLLGRRKSLPTAKAASAPKKRAANKEQNYKPLAFYETHGSGIRDGFDRFEAEGQHYFTYNRDGKIVMFSEGYPTAVARDRGVNAVEVNLKDEGRYSFGDVGGGYEGFRLRAKNNKEIARSPGYGDAAAAAAGAALLYGAGPKARAANVEQNYKPLDFYSSRISGIDEGFETFEEGGQHYFTYNRDGKPLLISEGYPTAAIRDKGIDSVRRNMEDESQYSYGAVGGGYEGFRLRARNNKEIARSIGYPTAAAAAAGAAFLFAPRPVAAVEPEPVVETKPIPVAPIAAAAAVPVAAAAMARPDPEPAAYTDPEPVMVHEEGAGLGWLPWLLGLLALGALAFLLLRMCSDRDVDAVIPVAAEPDPVVEPVVAEPVVAEPVVEEPVIEEPVMEAKPQPITCWDGSEAATFEDCPAVPEPDPEPEPEPAPVVTATPVSGTVRGNLRYADTAGTCSCAGASSTLFETDGAQRPVIVTRLGTNPEFGNHQGRDAGQFFATLDSRYASNGYDRTYLDYMARSLGYSGFEAMDASMFSETTVPNGSRVMLGYGEQHALQYSELALRDSADNSAFRVQSANGCDVAFMKTCGNFAYVCE